MEQPQTVSAPEADDLARMEAQRASVHAYAAPVAALRPDQGIHVYPPLVMRTDGPVQLGQELNGMPDSATVRIEPNGWEG
jgi:hypothetical protein